MENIIEALKSGIITHSPEETESVAYDLAQFKTTGMGMGMEMGTDTTITLNGDLGVGKTTFTKGFARGLGITKTITSPTFNLFSIYNGSAQLVHLDAYRLSPESSAESLMLDDFLTSPYCLLIEWPHNVPSLIPPSALHLRLSILESGTNPVHKIELIAVA